MTEGQRKARRATLLVRSVVAAVVVLSVAGLTATPVLAKCNPGSRSGGAYGDGFSQRPGARIGGIYSSILNYSAWVYPKSVGGLPNVVMAAVQLSDQYGDVWQIGWEEYSGGARDTIFCYAVPSPYGGYDNQCQGTGAQPTGSFTQYKIEYNNRANYFTFLINNNVIAYEPTNGLVPIYSAVFGDIDVATDQMPGGYNSTEQFGGTYYYYPNSWQPYNGGTFNDNGNYFGNHKSSAYFDSIWDWACAT